MGANTKLGGRFWRMWSATGISSIGDGMVATALPLLALSLTRNPLAVAGVMIADRAPAAFAALPVGALADRLNRRRLIVTIEIIRFAALGLFGLLVLTGRDSLTLIYVTAFLLGSMTVAFDVVAGAALPSVVPASELLRANGHLFNAELTGEQMAGQALGGVALAATRSLPFLADAASFIGSAILLRGAVPDHQPAPSATSAWADLKEGLRSYVGNPILRLLTAVIASLAFCQSIVLGLVALYATQKLGLSSAGYGLLLAVASIGNVLGGLLAPRFHRAVGGGAGILSAALLATAAYPVLAFTHSALVAGGALMAEGMAVIVGNVAARSIRQTVVPDEMQGRAASAYQMIIISCLPLGAAVGGVAANELGMRTTFLAAAVLQAAILAATGPRLVRRLRSALAPESAVYDLSGGAREVVEVVDLTNSSQAADTSSEMAPPPVLRTL